MFVYLRWSCTISGADDRDRTGDLVLTKDVLCQLSYIGIDGLAPSPIERRRSNNRGPFWSGRRESNPQPTAWKAVTLPLSYSRKAFCHIHFRLHDPGWPTRAADGGEGRIRTFEATGATDLQSVAFDRFATSPNPRPRLDGISCRNRSH